MANRIDPTGLGGYSFLATPSYSMLSAGSTILNELIGFPSVTAQVTAGGTDYATLYDAPGAATVFGGEPTDAYVRASAYYAAAYGFAQVSAFATAGNQDSGYLSDGPAGGTFLGQGNAAVLEGPPGFSLALYGYSSVIAYGSTGSNKLSVAAIDYLFSEVGRWMTL